VARLAAQVAQQGQLLRLLERRTNFLDVLTRDTWVQCNMERAQVARETPTALVVRPVTEVAGVQRISGSPTPPGRGPGQMPQTIPEIPMYAFGRGRGAVLIAQRYNIQMREHFCNIMRI
jgi:hypothetical protein